MSESSPLEVQGPIVVAGQLYSNKKGNSVILHDVGISCRAS